MQCITVVLVLLYAAVGHAHPMQTEPENACNITHAMKSVVKCWLDTENGKWLSGNDVLDIQDALRRADWQSIYDTGKTAKNLSLIGEKLLGGSDGVSKVGLAFGLIADDAVYAENAVETRNKMCSALRELLSCGEHHAKQCDDFLTNLLAQYIGRMLGTQSSLANVGADKVADMLDKKLCFLCKDDGEALKIVLATMLDGNKRKILREYTNDAKRDEIYKNCPAAAQAPAGTKVDKDYVKGLVASSNPCDAQPFASCVADSIHNEVNPDIPLNVIGVMTNLTFTEAMNCTGVDLPASFDTSKCPKTLMNHHDHADHEHHHRRKRAAGGESCDSAKVIQDTVECFISSEAGNKLTGPEGLNINEQLRQIKWKDVVDTVRKNPNNFTKVREVIYQGKMERAEQLRMEIAMWMDDAVNGENSAQVLQDACNGMKAGLKCLSNLRPCKNRYDRLLTNYLSMMSGDYTAPNMTVTGFAKTVDKQVCYMCHGNAEPLKVIFKTMLDGEKRKAIKNLMYNETNRFQSYRECPAASTDGRTPDMINKDYIARMAQDNVCQTYPFAKCFADDVHEAANKDVPTSYITDLNAIAYRVLFSCNDVEAPTTSGFDIAQCQTALAPGAE